MVILNNAGVVGDDIFKRHSWKCQHRHPPWKTTWQEPYSDPCVPRLGTSHRGLNLKKPSGGITNAYEESTYCCLTHNCKKKRGNNSNTQQQILEGDLLSYETSTWRTAVITTTAVETSRGMKAKNKWLARDHNYTEDARARALPRWTRRRQLTPRAHCFRSFGFGHSTCTFSSAFCQLFPFFFSLIM